MGEEESPGRANHRYNFRPKRSPSPIRSDWNRDHDRESLFDIDAVHAASTAYFEQQKRALALSKKRHINDDAENFEYNDLISDPNTNEVTESITVIQNNNTSRSTNPFASSRSLNREPLTGASHETYVMSALKNIGNSCYMNAVLYTLRVTPTLLHEVHHLFVNILILCTDWIELKDELPANTCYKRIANQTLYEDRLSECVELSITIRDVFVKFHEIFSKLASAERKGILKPIGTNTLQRAIFTENSTFVPLTQQDSHEFLMCVLNCLRDCTEIFLRLIEMHPQMFQRIRDPATNLSFNFFRENFMGQKLSTVYCIYCETKTQHEEEMIDLSVPLPAGSNVDANFIQTSCLSREMFTGKIFCRICLRLTESMQIITFPRLPRILIIQLSIFDNRLNKIKTPTPISLRLDCFCIECNANTERKCYHEYHLYGVIVHLGETPKSGHYMTYIKTLNGIQNRPYSCDITECCDLTLNRCDKTIDDLWYICNDDKITTVPEPEFLEMLHREASRNTPYILFYARSDLVVGK